MTALAEKLRAAGVRSAEDELGVLVGEARDAAPRDYAGQRDFLWGDGRFWKIAPVLFEKHKDFLVGPLLREKAGRGQWSYDFPQTVAPPANPKPGNGGQDAHDDQLILAAARASHAGGGDQGCNDAQTRLVAPARARSTPADLGALKKSVQKCVFDTFRITERNGEKTAIGDIPPSRYPALLGHLGKRSWVATREYNLIYLLDQHKPATYPLGAMTRDIFDEKQMLKFVAMATDMATPKLPEEARV